MKPAITDIPLEGLSAAVADLGLKPFVADQLADWLYKKRASSFDDMTNVSKPARETLKARFSIEAVGLVRFQTASDGTKKFLCRAADGAAAECVLIPAEDDRVTVCLSTQAGCAMGCSFCRTAGMGLERNLTQGEILGQLIVAMRHSAGPVTNVVLMGMGEPLANRNAVEAAIEVMLDGRAMGLSKRRITLSTCGLLQELDEFSLTFDVKIAISLNATTDEVRDILMPVNRKYPIAKIMEFCRAYSERSRHRVTFEYVLLGKVNDTKDDARRLVELLKGVRAKVNLIPFNPYEGSAYAAPAEETVRWWSEFLYAKGIQANIRKSRGQEIMAACGQLAASEGLGRRHSG